jgi:hypothetical protein
MAANPAKTFLIVTVFLLVTTGSAIAQTFVPTGRGTLRGLPGVEVMVENLESDIERDGLSRAAIQADVAGALRTAGIGVYATQQANPSDAKAYVYVRVNSIKLQTQGVYAIALDVQLRQTLRSLVTMSNIVDAMTWEQSNVVVVPVAQASSVRTEIQEYVGQFIQDWKAVH